MSEHRGNGERRNGELGLTRLHVASVYVYMHIRIYTWDVYMHLFEKNVCISLYASLCICRIERFLRCVYSVFRGIISSLLNFVVSEKIKNEWELDLVMKNSVWRRLRRAKKEI